MNTCWLGLGVLKVDENAGVLLKFGEARFVARSGSRAARAKLLEASGPDEAAASNTKQSKSTLQCHLTSPRPPTVNLHTFVWLRFLSRCLVVTPHRHQLHLLSVTSAASLCPTKQWLQLRQRRKPMVRI
jgi:hypothetical protein